MITFITGVPGSGKTYLAVNYMLKEKKPIYTNIDIVQGLQYQKFDFDEFYKKLEIIYQIIDKEQDRDIAIQKAKELEIFNIAIYFDECHLKLTNQDKIVVWWFSWHRHLNQDIFLITQNKTTIAQKYRVYPEIFVFAEPATKRFNSTTMRYVEYANYSMSKNQIIRRFSLKADAEVFKIYQTGESNKGQTYLRKKVYLIASFFLVPIIAFYFVINSFSNDTNAEIKNNNVHHVSTSEQNQTKTIQTDFYIVERIGEYVDVQGWLFKVDDKNLKKLFNFPHARHKISSTYVKYLFKDTRSKKYIDYLVSTRF